MSETPGTTSSGTSDAPKRRRKGRDGGRDHDRKDGRGNDGKQKDPKTGRKKGDGRARRGGETRRETPTPTPEPSEPPKPPTRRAPPRLRRGALTGPIPWNAHLETPYAPGAYRSIQYQMPTGESGSGDDGGEPPIEYVYGKPLRPEGSEAVSPAKEDGSETEEESVDTSKQAEREEEEKERQMKYAKDLAGEIHTALFRLQNLKASTEPDTLLKEVIGLVRRFGILIPVHPEVHRTYSEKLSQFQDEVSKAKRALAAFELTKELKKAPEAVRWFVDRVGTKVAFGSVYQTLEKEESRAKSLETELDEKQGLRTAQEERIHKMFVDLLGIDMPADELRDYLLENDSPPIARTQAMRLKLKTIKRKEMEQLRALMNGHNTTTTEIDEIEAHLTSWRAFSKLIDRQIAGENQAKEEEGEKISEAEISALLSEARDRISNASRRNLSPMEHKELILKARSTLERLGDFSIQNENNSEMKELRALLRDEERIQYLHQNTEVETLLDESLSRRRLSRKGWDIVARFNDTRDRYYSKLNEQNALFTDWQKAIADYGKTSARLIGLVEKITGETYNLPDILQIIDTRGRGAISFLPEKATFARRAIHALAIRRHENNLRKLALGCHELNEWKHELERRRRDDTDWDNSMGALDRFADREYEEYARRKRAAGLS